MLVRRRVQHDVWPVLVEHGPHARLVTHRAYEHHEVQGLTGLHIPAKMRRSIN